MNAPPPQSPFKPGYRPPGSLLGEPGSPFALDYDPDRWADPRLGILHLLGATTCVAVYFGLAQTAQLITADFVDRSDTRLVHEASWVLSGLGSGLALSGLLLWLARRWRGMPFPRHPGEHMLVVQAINCILGLGFQFLFAHLWVLSEQETLDLPVYLWWDKLLFVLFLIHALIWMVAGLRIGIRRWRRFFFLCAAARVLLGLVACGGVLSSTPYHVLYVLLSIVLIVIVVRDHRQGMRYPWSHWLSVGVHFWFTLLNLWWFVLETFFGT